MTPARIAAATAFTHTRRSEPSSSPAPSHNPSIRQIWLGMTPASRSTTSACQSPKKALIRNRSWLFPPFVDTIRDGARDHAADEDVEATVKQRSERIKRESQNQCENVRELPGITGGREQKREWRQQQDRRRKGLGETGGERVADHGGAKPDRDQAAPKP